jgi:hypothetical protein
VTRELDASADPVHLYDSADGLDAIFRWLCIDCFDLERVVGAPD